MEQNKKAIYLAGGCFWGMQKFIDQFNGKTAAELLAYSKTGASADNEIDVISGATVTTNAVTNAVNGAILAAEYLEEG